jgi:hypothetical protein
LLIKANTRTYSASWLAITANIDEESIEDFESTIGKDYLNPFYPSSYVYDGASLPRVRWGSGE